MTQKKIFKAAFIQRITETRRIENETQVISAMEKLGRFCNQRDGGNEWNLDDIGNALYFYDEYQKKATFNRNTRKINN